MALTEDVKQQIQQAYRDVLAGKDIRARYGQRLMIAEIARYMGEITDNDGQRTSPPATCVVEAGTGTGKTLAYLIAAIPVAKALGKTLVISTATVALQDQIVLKDLPDLRKHSKLDFSWTLAKGRGRYLCMSRLEARLHDEGHGDSDTMPLFLLDQPVDDEARSRATFENMLASYGSRDWDGDRDHWPEQIPDEIWRQVTTDHRQCTNRHCAYFDSCAFFDARKDLDDADVVVANHDLVLADLALGGGAILPDPRDCLYVFDEAHHLPDKAIGHFAHHTRLHATAEWLDQIDKNLSKLLAQHPLPGDLGRVLEQVPTTARDLKPHQQFMQQALGGVADFASAEDLGGNIRPQYRFENGEVPDELCEMGMELKAGFGRLSDQLQRIVDMLKEAMDGEATIGVSESQAEEWYPLFGALQARAEANWTLWTQFCLQDPEGKPPTARWLTLTEGGDIEVHVSPILAADTLRQYLWNPAFAALATSATLTALGKFDRFSHRAGLPRSAVCALAPSPFKHGEAGLLRVPNYGADPRDSVAHTAAIIEHLPEILADERGSLVLFSSRKQMLEVFAGVPAEFRQRVLVQGDLSKQELIRQHRKQVDDGKPSVIFGLASFAEGVDLPGKYCEHVVIAKIPFAVPDDPVEAALAEWIEKNGGNPFMEIAVPDASLRLIQACGRLLRTESDSGTVTVLDRRLVTQRYGKAILNALPPFRREID